MILNMHIRNDYDRWMLTPKKRVTTLCGKITETKYAGIPGITQGQDLVAKKQDDGNIDCAWCIKCCLNMLEEVDNVDFFWTYLKNINLRNLYATAIDLAAAQIELAYRSVK